jgi:hypothetical protein
MFTQLATKKVKPEEECLVITGEDHSAGQDKEVNKSINGMEMLEVWYGNTLLIKFINGSSRICTYQTSH